MSLAWWQVNPHLGHLWATTCPADPSWRPGEGHSVAWAQQFLAMRSKTGYANVKDTIIPLYPRRRARALCEDAVSGEITANDTVNWSGIKGTVAVQADKITTGLDMRDNYARHSILNTGAYPLIKYTIDSVGPFTKARRDTLNTTIYGTIDLHGVQHAIQAPAKLWHDAGALRVTAKMLVPAQDMIEVYYMSKYSLGLGVGQTVWDELWLGIDAILRPET
jgi:hypothetical protein